MSKDEEKEKVKMKTREESESKTRKQLGRTQSDMPGTSLSTSSSHKKGHFSRNRIYSL